MADGRSSGQATVHEFIPPQDGVGTGTATVHEYVPPQDAAGSGIIVVMEYRPPVPYPFLGIDPIQGGLIRTRRHLQGNLPRKFPGAGGSKP